MKAERKAVIGRLLHDPIQLSGAHTSFQLLTVYQGVSSVEDAVKMTNTKPLAYSKRNQGFFGAGPYFTTELGYARLYGHIVMVFTVAIFKPFAVLHGPRDPTFSMYGKRITGF